MGRPRCPPPQHIAVRRAEGTTKPHSHDTAQEKGSEQKKHRAKHLLVRVSLDCERVVFLLERCIVARYRLSRNVAICATYSSGPTLTEEESAHVYRKEEKQGESEGKIDGDGEGEASSLSVFFAFPWDRRFERSRMRENTRQHKNGKRRHEYRWEGRAGHTGPHSESTPLVPATCKHPFPSTTMECTRRQHARHSPMSLGSYVFRSSARWPVADRCRRRGLRLPEPSSSRRRLYAPAPLSLTPPWPLMPRLGRGAPSSFSKEPSLSEWV